MNGSRSLSPLSTLAREVHAHANEALFAVLLDTLDRSAAVHGIVFGSHTVPPVTAFDPDDSGVWAPIGEAVARARLTFLYPNLADSKLENAVARDVDEGYAMKWTHTLLSALRACGRYPVHAEAPGSPMGAAT